MLLVSSWKRLYLDIFIICHLLVNCDAKRVSGVLTNAVLKVQKSSKTEPKYKPAFVASGLVLADSKRNCPQDGKSASGTSISIIKQCCKIRGIDSIGAISLLNGLEEHAKAISKKINSCVQRVRNELVANEWYRRIQSGIEVMKQKLVTLSTTEQILLAIVGKLFYAFKLPGFHILFPYQLIPVTSGFGVDVGLDTIVSLGSSYLLWKSVQHPEGELILKQNDKFLIPLVGAGLLGSFYISGYAAQVVDNGMLLFSAMDLPISPALQRSMRILLSHLTWVFIGAKMLNYVVPLNSGKCPWFRMDAQELWVYKALTGYFVSCGLYNVTDTIFNIAEALKKLLEPHDTEMYDEMSDNVLMEPSDLIPSIITALGPCITAPWWEEMLYRIFVFKTMNLKLPRNVATCIAALIFAVHHMNPRSVLQLFSLGVLWSLIEQGTNNVFISIAIHSLWNTRIMLGTLLGK
ncbi:CAAX amino terminal protease family protein [Babesia ovis]|uniref:CAAX amino terminal protease family protein n=1 Tax=Babesia ovis TaxID=5869 RepID=A0A9W5WTG1_BABOV|nr:CAAX amino terminal protease family protein [Babesia ovis]